MVIRAISQPAARVRMDTRADGKPVIVGYAAVYYNTADPGTQFTLWEGGIERIAPGAFDAAIVRDDVRALFNHDPSLLLGRKSAGSLALTADDVGLRYEITPGDTTVARDVAEFIKRGELQGSSFAFDYEGYSWTKEGDIDVLTILSVRLYDVGPVTFPAYDATSTGMRSVGSGKTAGQLHAAWMWGNRVRGLSRQRACRARIATVESEN